MIYFFVALLIITLIFIVNVLIIEYKYLSKLNYVLYVLYEIVCFCLKVRKSKDVWY